jgi:osmoprotectant transport system ATP-binding protein
MIRFEGVTKRYAGAPGHAPSVAVDDLTLEAPDRADHRARRAVGCGKTTTLRMVNRMITPTSGSIWPRRA